MREIANRSVFLRGGAFYLYHVLTPFSSLISRFSATLQEEKRGEGNDFFNEFRPCSRHKLYIVALRSFCFIFVILALNHLHIHQ